MTKDRRRLLWLSVKYPYRFSRFSDRCLCHIDGKIHNFQHPGKAALISLSIFYIIVNMNSAKHV
jgi:hypothetical protein